MSVRTKQSTSPRNQHADCALGGWCYTFGFLSAYFITRYVQRKYFQTLTKCRKKRAISFVVSVLSDPIGRIFVKFDAGKYFWKSVERIQIILKSDRDNGQFIGRPKYFYVVGSDVNSWEQYKRWLIVKYTLPSFVTNHNSWTLFSRAKLTLPKWVIYIYIYIYPLVCATLSIFHTILHWDFTLNLSRVLIFLCTNAFKLRT